MASKVRDGVHDPLSVCSTPDQRHVQVVRCTYEPRTTLCDPRLCIVCTQCAGGRCSAVPQSSLGGPVFERWFIVRYVYSGL